MLLSAMHCPVLAQFHHQMSACHFLRMTGGFVSRASRAIEGTATVVGAIKSEWFTEIYVHCLNTETLINL